MRSALSLPPVSAARAPNSLAGSSLRNSSVPPRLLVDAVSSAPAPCDTTMRPMFSEDTARLACSPLWLP
jgi:hypothetical protein